MILFPVLACLVAMGLIGLRHFELRRERRSTACLCGYSLAGLEVEATCPECGRADARTQRTLTRSSRWELRQGARVAFAPLVVYLVERAYSLFWLWISSGTTGFGVASLSETKAHRHVLDPWRWSRIETEGAAVLMCGVLLHLMLTRHQPIRRAIAWLALGVLGTLVIGLSWLWYDRYMPSMPVAGVSRSPGPEFASCLFLLFLGGLGRGAMVRAPGLAGATKTAGSIVVFACLAVCGVIAALVVERWAGEDPPTLWLLIAYWWIWPGLVIVARDLE